MKDIDKENLKEQFINLYLQGKTMQEISKLTGWSRNYVGKIIKDDDRIKKYRNYHTVKVYKYKMQNKMNIPIAVGFLEKIGISRDLNVEDFIDVILDENEKTITLKKHNI